MSEYAGWYKLDDNGDAVPCSFGEWYEWRTSPDGTDRRRVCYDEINGYRVSTVFLGLDHQFGDGPPVLWETMVFPGDSFDEDFCERYSSKADAIAGHAKAIEFAKTLGGAS